jgi:hypothetical protein
MEFYKEVFKLNGWNCNAGRMSPIMGAIVNDLVYARLAPGVLDELKKRNPVTLAKGHMTEGASARRLVRHQFSW